MGIGLFGGCCCRPNAGDGQDVFSSINFDGHVLSLRVRLGLRVCLSRFRREESDWPILRGFSFCPSLPPSLRVSKFCPSLPRSPFLSHALTHSHMLRCNRLSHAGIGAAARFSRENESVFSAGRAGRLLVVATATGGGAGAHVCGHERELFPMLILARRRPQKRPALLRRGR
jgi:hypothetical protein